MSATGRERAAVIGGGPAGLAAAEAMSENGVSVVIYEKMPTPGRKFLMAGRGGLNLTHSEPLDGFLDRYGEARSALSPAIDAFTPDDLRAWADGLGAETFTGSSGRIFPKAMKASPLLRAWRARLEDRGVRIETRRRWAGWTEQGGFLIEGPDGTEDLDAGAVVLALGGASWPRLGSDGTWTGWLEARGVPLARFQPSNAGFQIAWSGLFGERFAGEPIKTAAFTANGRSVRGEAMISGYGIEGGAIYALGRELRGEIEREGRAILSLDLKPDIAETELAGRLSRQPAKASLTNQIRKGASLSPAAVNLVYEAERLAHGHVGDFPRDPTRIASRIKAVRLPLTGLQGLDRAISSTGGVRFEALDARFMLTALPGVFACGEMLDWDAPTGGYLLQACFATGRAAGRGATDWIRRAG